MTNERSVVVIGGGAAGLIAAIHAAGTGSVTVLERNAECGRKILASGGGRCNILPITLDETRFVTSSSRNTLKKVVRSWPLHEMRHFFENEARITLKDEAETGKVFPASGRANEVRDALVTLAAARGARIETRSTVTGIFAEEGRWRIERDGAAPLHAEKVVLATGGLAAPETGSDGAGLSFLKSLGHEIVPPCPALVPLEAESREFAPLAGVSLEATVTVSLGKERVSATGGFLFTHRGFSGPSVFDVSHAAMRSLCNPSGPARVLVDWNSIDEGEWLAAFEEGRRDGATVAGVIAKKIPSRLADLLVARAAVAAKQKLTSLTRADRDKLIAQLVRCELPWTRGAGYDRAEVTAGGLSLAEINSVTMESKRCSGLHICGELLDACGPVGGYNFLWAWVTGRAAGK